MCQSALHILLAQQPRSTPFMQQYYRTTAGRTPFVLYNSQENDVRRAVDYRPYLLLAQQSILSHPLRNSRHYTVVRATKQSTRHRVAGQRRPSSVTATKRRGQLTSMMRAPVDLSPTRHAQDTDAKNMPQRLANCFDAPALNNKSNPVGERKKQERGGGRRTKSSVLDTHDRTTRRRQGAMTHSSREPTRRCGCCC